MLRNGWHTGETAAFLTYTSYFLLESQLQILVTYSNILRPGFFECSMDVGTESTDYIKLNRQSSLCVKLLVQVASNDSFQGCL